MTSTVTNGRLASTIQKIRAEDEAEVVHEAQLRIAEEDAERAALAEQRREENVLKRTNAALAEQAEKRRQVRVQALQLLDASVCDVVARLDALLTLSSADSVINIPMIRRGLVQTLMTSNPRVTQCLAGWVAFDPGLGTIGIPKD
jgi:hypothetical protein